MAEPVSRRRSFALLIYVWLTHGLSFLAPILIGMRQRQGKELPGRERERLGHATKPRPVGKLIWFHCASLGESSVVKIVIDALRARGLNLPILVTTTTKSSALFWQKLDLAGVTHQFAPVDFPEPCRRFLRHWRPDIGLFVESELWPNLLRKAHRNGVKLALINARMNAKSLSFWSFWARDFQSLLSNFSWIGVADKATFQGLSLILTPSSGKNAVATPPISPVGNLKAALTRTTFSWAEQETFRHLSSLVGSRFIWLGASTHVGEDEILLRAHSLLRQDYPDALLILVPRKPERGKELAALATSDGFVVTRWSEMRTVDSTQAVLIGDSLGEMDLWLGLCHAVFVGGSLLAQFRGHNPMEAIAHGRCVLVGPHFDSFADLYALLFDHDLAQIAGDAQRIASILREQMSALKERQAYGRTDATEVEKVLQQGQNAINITVEHINALIHEVPDARP